MTFMLRRGHIHGLFGCLGSSEPHKADKILDFVRVFLFALRGVLTSRNKKEITYE